MQQQCQKSELTRSVTFSQWLLPKYLVFEIAPVCGVTTAVDLVADATPSRSLICRVFASFSSSSRTLAKRRSTLDDSDAEPLCEAGDDDLGAISGPPVLADCSRETSPASDDGSPPDTCGRSPGDEPELMDTTDFLGLDAGM